MKILYPCKPIPTTACLVQPHGDNLLLLTPMAFCKAACNRAQWHDEFCHEIRKCQDLEVVDVDHDGIPDDYENNNGLSPLEDDANDDLDNDGFINIHEYVAGTVANSSSSLLKISQTLPPIGYLWNLTWLSVTSKSYNIFAAAPEPGGLVSLIDTNLSASSGSTTSQDIPLIDDNRIYFIEVIP